MPMFSNIFQKYRRNKSKNKHKKIVAKVIYIDYLKKKIIFNYFKRKAVCSFLLLGELKKEDIQNIFKPNSIHQLSLINDNYSDEDILRLNYRAIHPEVWITKSLLIPTFSGSSNLRKFLNSILKRRINYEENSHYSS